MITKKMFKIIILIFSINILLIFKSFAATQNFEIWLGEFKDKAVNSGISPEVVNSVMAEAKFLPKVIEYDRFQPEFYEDTFTYIKKRSSKKKT